MHIGKFEQMGYADIKLLGHDNHTENRVLNTNLCRIPNILKILTLGVTKETILIAFFFLIFINDLTDTFSSSIPVHSDNT